VLDEVHGTPEAYPLGVAYLRSMKLAAYSQENTGHYGLGSDAYLHFTSPIRRYPDLVVHRSLDARKPRSTKTLDELNARLKQTAAHCSETERNAEGAERELRAVATLRYLEKLAKQRRPAALNGIVRDVKSFGMIVSLVDYLTEGTLRASSLVDDYYRFHRPSKRLIGRRRHKVFRVGMPLKVKLLRVDVFSRTVELQVVG